MTDACHIHPFAFDPMKLKITLCLPETLKLLHLVYLIISLTFFVYPHFDNRIVSNEYDNVFYTYCFYQFFNHFRHK